MADFGFEDLTPDSPLDAASVGAVFYALARTAMREGRETVVEEAQRTAESWAQHPHFRDSATPAIRFVIDALAGTTAEINARWFSA